MEKIKVHAWNTIEGWSSMHDLEICDTRKEGTAAGKLQVRADLYVLFKLQSVESG
jgi:hypothetical protein